MQSAMLYHLLLVCSLTGIALSDAGLPGRDTDCILVLQRPPDIGVVNFGKSKQFLEDFLDEYREDSNIDHSDPVRVAAVYYDKYVHVAFDLQDGYNLNNVHGVKEAVAAIPYDPEPGSDLTGALLKSLEIIDSQSSPGRIQIVVVVSDGVTAGPWEHFVDAVDMFRTMHSIVITIAVGAEVDTYTLELLSSSNHNDDDGSWGDRRRSVSDDSIVTVDDYSQLPSAVDNTLRDVERFLSQSCVTTILQPCPERCVGLHVTKEVCTWYVCTFPIYEEVEIHQDKCCRKPCPAGQHPGPTPSPCFNFPPANGDTLDGE